MLAVEQLVLNPQYHASLIRELDDVASIAKVPAYMIKQSAKGYLNTVTLDWVRDIRKHSKVHCYGLVLRGKFKVPIEQQFMAIAGALIRNYIDARIYSLGELIEDEGGHVPDCSVLLIPNFYTGVHGKPLAGWQIQKLYSILITRMMKEKQTILYVSDLGLLEQHYGNNIVQLLKNNYVSQID